ncbi:GTPase-activating protein CdGAPr isoform X2 [Agrilus planipennis]|nr:GTPase-activating protein CdGAPr isoform X2 [Agrilus planipennis]
MQISEVGIPGPEPGAEPCRFPKLEECAHFHYERVQLPRLEVTLQDSLDKSLHSQHTNEEDDSEYYMVQVSSAEECWLVQRNYENFRMLDAQIHQCIFDRKISQLPDLSSHDENEENNADLLKNYLERFSVIADNSVNCGPVLNWFQMDNKGHRLLVPSEESRSINTPAVAAAYSVRRYVSQARDELNLEVGDMISVIDMTSPAESVWWRGKRGFQVGFFPQHCVHIIGDKVPRNMPVPPPVVGSLAISPVKPVLRKHGKLIAFFRSFILNRPSRRRLKQSGILKERVFGCDLGEHLLNSGHDIPMVLKCCAEFIEKHGIVDGIYRLSGITSNIQKLRNTFDEDRIPDLYTEDILQDIHSVASLLKMYFRELPNPLCTYQLYQGFVSAVQGCHSVNRNSTNDRDRLLKMREVVQKLPPPHYRTLEYLMRHLARVAKHGPSTGMTTRNIAIVWAPNLLRCAELEVGGVAALQGVGVQAVVTEFLICYTDLIFCDHLPTLAQSNLDVESSMSPKRLRPKSLAISTPTKLITLEEARSKHLLSKSDESGYIEVGGGPRNLPKKYHTIIELPSGSRKRGFSKRSPLGWRSFFTRTRNNSQGSLSKARKASTPGNIIMTEKAVTESDLTEMKRKLRPVKSAESLTSGHSEPASTEDILAPLHNLNKPPGHNRSVSHDSYFDTLQNSQNNSEGSLLDLSEIQLNFELEESEMRIFSEDESLVSSPRNQKDVAFRRYLTRPRTDDYSTSSNNPSPKKQPRVVLSPDSISRKRTRLEDQLSDIQYIDCNTPENNYIFSTTAVIHQQPDEIQKTADVFESYQPKNKSPRNSEVEFKRQSLNLEKTTTNKPPSIPKSLTESNIESHLKFLSANVSNQSSSFASPQSPKYKRLNDSSANVSPLQTPEDVPYQKMYQNLNKGSDSKPPVYENVDRKSSSPVYENILTTISITYKSPVRTPKSPNSTGDYENVDVLNPEQAVVPTVAASLPLQQATQPNFVLNDTLDVIGPEKNRPKSAGATDFNKATDMTSAIIESDTKLWKSDPSMDRDSRSCSEEASTIKGNSDSMKASMGTNNELTITDNSFYENESTLVLSPTASSLSEVVQTSTELLNTSHSSLNFPGSPSRLSPIVSSLQDTNHSESDTAVSDPESKTRDDSSQESLIIDDKPENLLEARFYNPEYLKLTDNVISPFEDRDLREIKLVGDGIGNCLSLKEEIQNLREGLRLDLNDDRPKSINLIEFSPNTPTEALRNATTDKRKSCTSEEETIDDENNIYQQVKYFRRSVHEVNALLDMSPESKEQINNKNSNLQNVRPDFSLEPEVCDKLSTESQSIVEKEIECDISTDVNEDKQPKSAASPVSFDSLESDRINIEKNVETVPSQTCDSALTIDDSSKDNPEIKSNNQTQVGVNVKSLTDKFEAKESDLVDYKPPLFGGNRGQRPSLSLPSPKPERNPDKSREKVQLDSLFGSSSSLGEERRVYYDRSCLPPCLRAKHLRNSAKTRSLDEDEFSREFGDQSLTRRKSLDESLSYKVNDLPKTLNPPKPVPLEIDLDIHCSHSLLPLTDQKLNRERIEKYKEERRKFLHEKYRSESFKENKEVLLSRMKQKGVKGKEGEEEKIDAGEEIKTADVEGKINDEEVFEELPQNKNNGAYSKSSDKDKSKSGGDVIESIKLKTAIFESQINNHNSSEKPKILSKKNDLNKSTKGDINWTQKGDKDVKNLQNSRGRTFTPIDTERNISSVEPQEHNEKKIQNTFERKYHPVGQSNNEPVKDSNKGHDTTGSRNAFGGTGFRKKSVGDEVGDVNRDESSSDKFVSKRAADFRSPGIIRKNFDARSNPRECDNKINDFGQEIIRNKLREDNSNRNERRRHTYETRERDTDSERTRRISLESSSPRKEKSPPSYCIKDMKAIFEQKSQK